MNLLASFVIASANPQIILRGRHGGEDLVIGLSTSVATLITQPLFLLGVLTAFLISGALLIGLEVRTESHNH